MSYDEAAAARVRRILARRSDVVEKRMVGGRSFMVNGHLCCGITGSAVMVRVGPADYAGALGRPHVRPMMFAGKAPLGYVLVDPSGYATDSALEAWVQRGLDFVATLASSEPKSPRRRPR